MHDARGGRIGRIGQIGLAGLAVAAAVAASAVGSAARAADPPKPTDEPRVILLTGFEPFGEKKPPNPSWEAVKALDGQSWHGRRLVARRLPVVWGAPLKQLEAWVAELRPVAVIAFGQGGEGGFSIESWAYNERSDRAKDNLENTRPTPEIVADGPRRIDASIDSLKLAKKLAEKGYRVNVSTNAGRYLCEETLYSLEYLKAADRIDGPVLFCHVPPLGSKLNKTRRVDEDYVQRFAKDLLDAWRDADADKPAPPVDPSAMAAAVAPAAAAAIAQAQPEPAAADLEREREVKTFVEHYFKCWSDQDMDAYDDCFMTDACIQYVDAQGRMITTLRQRFVASQRDVHRRSSVRSIEVPESIEVRFEQKLARVVAYWRLNAGARVQKGYDHFTLIHDRGRWRIANLLFYATSGD